MKLDEKQKLDNYKSGYQSFIFALILTSFTALISFVSKKWNLWFPPHIQLLAIFIVSTVFFTILKIWRGADPNQNNEKLFRKNIIRTLITTILLILNFRNDLIFKNHDQLYFFWKNGSAGRGFIISLVLICQFFIILALIIRYFLNKKEDL